MSLSASKRTGMMRLRPCKGCEVIPECQREAARRPQRVPASLQEGAHLGHQFVSPMQTVTSTNRLARTEAI